MGGRGRRAVGRTQFPALISKSGRGARWDDGARPAVAPRLNYERRPAQRALHDAAQQDHDGAGWVATWPLSPRACSSFITTAK